MQISQELIGRVAQRRELAAALASPKAEMIAVIGRRRIGKTFLIRQAYGDQIDFELTGLQNESTPDQLFNFWISLKETLPVGEDLKRPTTWLEAFYALSVVLDGLERDRKLIVFFDELPWLASKRSGFLTALGWFWNSWAVKRAVVVVISGSAASWMIDKVVNDRGGLHNRITRLLSLPPFTLAETEAFCKSRNIRLNREQILQLYLTIGGVPMYLDQLKAGLSAVQNIQAICFAPTGYLRDEFDRLYHSLFSRPDRHIAIIRALASKRIGMNRAELLAATKLENGGSFTRLLDELAASGFISVYGGFKKQVRENLYRLTDAYSLFYLTYIEKLGQGNPPNFTKLSELPRWVSWSGYAFENVCLTHTDQIKKALGVSGIATSTASFQARGNDERRGAQIDLLIDRSDRSINICEAKYTQQPFTVTKAYATTIRQKLTVFAERTNTRKHLFFTLISVAGVKPNAYSEQLVDQLVVLDDLYAA